MRCVAHRCPDEAEPKRQLCAAHRKRLERGEGLPIAGEIAKGDPSGHGLYGILDTDPTGILCHECGHRFIAVGQHALRTHQLTPDEYRQRHGITGSLKLPGPSGRRRPRPCRCGRLLTGTAKMCLHCRMRRAVELAALKAPRPPRWRDITEAEREQLAAASTDQLGPLINQLQLDRVPSKQIAAAIGRPPQWMSIHWPRPKRSTPAAEPS